MILTTNELLLYRIVSRKRCYTSGICTAVDGRVGEKKASKRWRASIDVRLTPVDVIFRLIQWQQLNSKSTYPLTKGNLEKYSRRTLSENPPEHHRFFSNGQPHCSSGFAFIFISLSFLCLLWRNDFVFVFEPYSTKEVKWRSDEALSKI